MFEETYTNVLPIKDGIKKLSDKELFIQTAALTIDYEAKAHLLKAKENELARLNASIKMAGKVVGKSKDQFEGTIVGKDIGFAQETLKEQVYKAKQKAYSIGESLLPLLGEQFVRGVDRSGLSEKEYRKQRVLELFPNDFDKSHKGFIFADGNVAGMQTPELPQNGLKTNNIYRAVKAHHMYDRNITNEIRLCQCVRPVYLDKPQLIIDQFVDDGAMYWDKNSITFDRSNGLSHYQKVGVEEVLYKAKDAANKSKSNEEHTFSINITDSQKSKQTTVLSFDAKTVDVKSALKEIENALVQEKTKTITRKTTDIEITR